MATNKLGNKLKIAREHLGKSQKEMAALSGIGYRSWQGYEQGTNTPGGKVFEILTALGFNVSWFFNDNVQMMLDDSSGLQQIDKSTNLLFQQDNELVPPMPSDNLGMAEGMTILGRIYGSGDQVFIRAINANLHAFNAALDNKSKAEEAVERLREMENRMSKLEQRLTSLEEENKKLKNKPPDCCQQAEG